MDGDNDSNDDVEASPLLAWWGDDAAFWADNLGHADVCVAVLDGRVDLSHPCFVGAKLEVPEVPEVLGHDEGPPTDHGTHTASVIFGQPGTSVRGVAPSCSGLLIPVFADIGRDTLGCTQGQLASAIRLAVERGAHIINISGGQIVQSPEHGLPALVEAVRLCERRNVLIVAAAGNDGCRCLHVPAALRPVLAVGAVGQSGAPMDWSNWGDAYQQNGIMAPGRDIVGAALGGGVKTFDGTSCSTAVVSGISALLVSLQRALNRGLDPLAARQALLDSAARCDASGANDCTRVLVGTVRVQEAAKLIQTNVVDLPLASNEREFIMGEASENTEVTCSCGAGEACRCGSQTAAPSSIPTTVQSRAPSEPAGAQVRPSASSRPWTGGGDQGGSQLVYFIGELGFDFGGRTRLDSFTQKMKGSPHDPRAILDHLDANPWAAASVIWTVGHETIPVYAVAPFSFQEVSYARLRELMRRQLDGEAARISIPGVIGGMATLLCGNQIPVIVPDLRGVSSWERAKIKVVSGTTSKKKGSSVQERDNFLDRIFYELRSAGLSHDDRAINFAAHEGHEIHAIFDSACSEMLALEKITVNDSPICRPGSICRDVVLTFFDPKARFENARKAYRLTIDVADTVPSRIGEVRSWHIY